MQILWHNNGFLSHRHIRIAFHFRFSCDFYCSLSALEVNLKFSSFSMPASRRYFIVLIMMQLPGRDNIVFVTQLDI